MPIAIPISCLIATLLFFQRLSRTSELTALRAAGLGLWSILSPILLCSLLLSLFNFSLCAELAPFCRREGKTLLYQETSQNPLLLLKRQSLIKIKHTYLNMNVKDEETTKDLTLIVHNEANQRLNLLSARKLRIVGDELIGGNLSIVSYLPEEGFDSLIVENQSEMSTSAPLLSTALKRNRPRLDINAMSLKMLRIRSQEEGKKALLAQAEIARRFCLSAAVFTFTLLGCAFGIEQGRAPSKSTLFKALLLALIALVSYLFTKGLKQQFLLGLIAFLFPQLLIAFCSFFRLHRISKGMA